MTEYIKRHQPRETHEIVKKRKKKETKTEKVTIKQTNKQTKKQTNKPTNKQTKKQTNKETNQQRNKQKKKQKIKYLLGLWPKLEKHDKHKMKNLENDQYLFTSTLTAENFSFLDAPKP